MSDRTVPCYLGVDTDGLVVSACVDNPEHKKDVAKFVAEAVRDGLHLERCQVGDLWDGTVKLYQPLPSRPLSGSSK